MKNIYLSKGFFIFTLIWSCAAASYDFSYNELRLKEYDEMEQKVQKRVRAAETFGDDDLENAKAELKDALQLILARPDNDNMVAKLVPRVRGLLKNIESFEPIIKDIAADAISVLGNGNSSSDDMATAIVILGNLMTELKPEVNKNPKIKSIYALIRDAKIEVSEKVKKDLKKKASMKPPKSPSEVAASIIGEK